MTKKEIEQIKKAFELDATPQEVSFETGIPYDKILEWLAIDENMKLVEALKLKPKWEAKKLVVEDSKTNVKTAQWYLERKAKDEWSTRTESESKLTGDITISWQE